MKTMLKIIGIEERNGTYQNKPFHNHHIHCVSDKVILAGNSVESYKINDRTMNHLLNKYKKNDPKELVGLQFDSVLFDAYKNVADFR